MDNRVPFTTTPNGEIFALRQKFKDLAAAEKEVDKIIARREGIAGRPLTSRELRDGLILKDDQDSRAKITAANWKPTTVVEPDDDNPFRAAREQPREPRNRKELMAKAERDWDAKLEGEAAAAARAADPRRQKAIAAADAIIEQVAFDPKSTTSQLVAAEQLRRQADHDLDAFDQMFAPITDARAARFNSEAAAAQAEFDKARQRLQLLKPEAFAKIERSRYGDGKEYFEQVEGGKMTRRWEVGLEPAEIKEQFEAQK